MRVRHLKNKIVILGTLLLSFLAAPVSAVSTSKTGANYYVNNGTGNVGWHSQGATMTKDYWIWTDWKKSNGPTYIVMCKRSKPSNCSRSGAKNYGHASTLYHKWGTDYFLIKEKSDVKACWSISKKKEISTSKCNSLKNEFKIGNNLSTYSVPQGYTRYGNFFLRGYGNTPGDNHIVLYDKNFKILKKVALPNWVNEIEDVMVDGTTGDVYFSTLQYVNNKKQVQFHKIAKSTFSNWIKPYTAPSSGGGTPSNPSNPFNPSNPSTPSNPSNPSTPSTPTHTPVESKYDGSVDTNFFGKVQEDSKGCGVFMILNLIIDILTFGIAIAATIGIVVSGITYLTAKDNEQQTTKAKRRIYEIVIGLVAYAVLYAALKFLLPGGFNSNITCAKTTDTTISQQKTA